MAYGLLSVLWSDFPLIAGKRWIKTLGHPVMALIILTEPERHSCCPYKREPSPEN